MKCATQSTCSVSFSTFKTTFLQIACGSLFLTLMAQIAVPLPFTPVPFTLQTLGVALLAIGIGKNAFPSVIFYLMQATVGFPVLALGAANPLWLIGPKAGYLIGFAASSWLIYKLMERNCASSKWVDLGIIALGEAAVLILGTAWLTTFIGAYNAVILGFLPFLPGALCKIAVAFSSIKPIRWVQQKL